MHYFSLFIQLLPFFHISRITYFRDIFNYLANKTNCWKISCETEINSYVLTFWVRFATDGCTLLQFSVLFCYAADAFFLHAKNVLLRDYMHKEQTSLNGCSSTSSKTSPSPIGYICWSAQKVEGFTVRKFQFGLTLFPRLFILTTLVTGKF